MCTYTSSCSQWSQLNSYRIALPTNADRREEGKPKCLNMYDVRLYDDSPACGMNWPPDLPAMYTYLRVRTAIQVSTVTLYMASHSLVYTTLTRSIRTCDLRICVHGTDF